MTPDVPAICAGLTKAQRRMVIESEPGGHGLIDQACGAEVHGAGKYAVARALVAADLGDLEEHPGFYPSALYFNNSDGLAVRAHILKEQQP